MKTLRNIFEYADTFPDKKSFKKEDGITSIEWFCGNETCKEYLAGNLNGTVCTQVRPWFDRYFDRINTIVINIYSNNIACIYFDIKTVGGRGIMFEHQFGSIREAKEKMYEILCKIRDDKKIFRKMSDKLNANPDKYHYMDYNEFMEL